MLFFLILIYILFGFCYLKFFFGLKNQLYLCIRIFLLVWAEIEHRECCWISGRRVVAWPRRRLGCVDFERRIFFRSSPFEFATKRHHVKCLSQPLAGGACVVVGFFFWFFHVRLFVYSLYQWRLFALSQAFVFAANRFVCAHFSLVYAGVTVGLWVYDQCFEIIEPLV